MAFLFDGISYLGSVEPQAPQSRLPLNKCRMKIWHFFVFVILKHNYLIYIHKNRFLREPGLLDKSKITNRKNKLLEKNEQKKCLYCRYSYDYSFFCNKSRTCKNLIPERNQSAWYYLVI